MKIAFVGKGGSGKTTMSALTARHLATKGRPVLAIDADINQHLGQTLGLAPEQVDSLPAMGLNIDRIKTYLRGDNKRIPSNEKMIKTTPPGSGSRLMRVTETNPIYEYFATQIEGVTFMAVGPFERKDLGVKCYHSKTGSVELILNHMIESNDEYVVVDMTAGADAFASGLFTRFDITFLVVEPTVKSVGVYNQYQKYAKEHDVKIQVLANKCENKQDVAFIKDRVGDSLAAVFYRSDYVRAIDKGKSKPLDELEDKNKQALERMVAACDKTERDWATFYQQAKEFHRKNAKSWANDAVGADVTTQIDPDFSLTEAVQKRGKQ